MFAASPSRVRFAQVSRSDGGFWHRACCAARRKNGSNGLITKSVKSAEPLILLISVLSYFLETRKALHRGGLGTNLCVHTGATSRIAIQVVPRLVTAEPPDIASSQMQTVQGARPVWSRLTLCKLYVRCCSCLSVESWGREYRKCCVFFTRALLYS